MGFGGLLLEGSKKDLEDVVSSGFSVLCIDRGDVLVSEIEDLLEHIPSTNLEFDHVKSLEDADPNKNYDILIVKRSGPCDDDLIDRITERYGGVTMVVLGNDKSVMPLLEMWRMSYPGNGGVLYSKDMSFVNSEDEATDVPVDPDIVQSALQEKMATLQRFADGLISSSVTMNLELYKDTVDRILLDDTAPEDQKRTARICKKAIELIEKGEDVLGAIQVLTDAEETCNDKLLELLHYSIWQQATDHFLSIGRDALEDTQDEPAYEKLAAEELQRRPVKARLSMPRPSFNDINLYEGWGGSLLFCRSSPDYQSVRDEADRLDFYRRISRRLENPKMLSVPRKRFLFRSDTGGGSLFRSFVSGVRLMDFLRLKISKMESPGSAEKVRNTVMEYLTRAVSQCAFMVACGPEGLARKYERVLETYYIPRLEERIMEPFDQLFAKYERTRITAEEREMLANDSIGIHIHLSTLPVDYYTDRFVGNTILIRRGRAMIAVDLESVMLLPKVIDLATLLCYGGFTKSLYSRRPTPEIQLVDNFYITHAKAVGEFNSIVEDFEDDTADFMRDEMESDIKEYGGGKRDALMGLLEYTKGMFERPQDVADWLEATADDIKAGKLESVPARHEEFLAEYVYDLRTYVLNLKKKPCVEVPEYGTDDYKGVMAEFRRDYYAALFHRSLLMAGTHAGYVCRVAEDERNKKALPKKQALLLGEMARTVATTERSLRPLYDHGIITPDQRIRLRGICRSLFQRILACQPYVPKD